MFTKFIRSIISVIKGSGNNKNIANDFAKKCNVRLHQRFSTNEFPVAYIEQIGERKVHLPVINISYGGCAIDVSSIPLMNDWPTNISQEVSINMLGDMHIFSAGKVYGIGNTLGMVFHHHDQATLSFLRPYIENMRRGSSVTSLSKEFLNPKYQTADWRVLRGNGPVDVYLRINTETDEILEALLTYPLGENYADIQLKAGKISTLIAVNKQEVLPHMPATNEIDAAVLREGVFVLLGAHNAYYQPGLSHFLNIAMKTLLSLY